MGSDVKVFVMVRCVYIADVCECMWQVCAWLSVYKVAALYMCCDRCIFVCVYYESVCGGWMCVVACTVYIICA